MKLTREEAIEIVKPHVRFNGSQGESHISAAGLVQALHDLGLLPLAEKADRK